MNLGKIKQVKLSQVKLNSENPRTITNENLQKLIISILVFPKMQMIRPIVVDNLMQALGGNMRNLALNRIAKMDANDIARLLHSSADYARKTEGEKQALLNWWADWLDNPTAYIIDASELTEDERKQFVIKDNSSFGQWDYEALANKWDTKSLDDWGVPVWNASPIAFTPSGSAAPSAASPIPDMPDASEDDDTNVSIPKASEDEFDEEQESIETRVKFGEVWLLGKHRLMCGDSANKEMVSILMGEDRADMTFTGPPYGVAIGDKNKVLNEKREAKAIEENIANDNIPIEKLYEILVAAMRNCRESSKPDASYYVTSPQGGDLGLMMMEMMKDAGLPVRHILIWKKNTATFSLGRLDYDYQHEPIFYTWTERHHNYRNGEHRTTIWEYDKPRKCDLHPTMKPVGLVANCMMDGTKEDDIVLDLFGGSGTTIIAAEQLGRKARVMELSPHYCDVIIARWEKLTGNIATLEK